MLHILHIKSFWFYATHFSSFQKKLFLRFTSYTPGWCSGIPVVRLYNVVGHRRRSPWHDSAPRVPLDPPPPPGQIHQAASRWSGGGSGREGCHCIILVVLDCLCGWVTHSQIMQNILHKHGQYVYLVVLKYRKIASKPYVSTVSAIFQLFAKQWFYEELVHIRCSECRHSFYFNSDLVLVFLQCRLTVIHQIVGRLVLEPGLIGSELAPDHADSLIG